MTLWTHWDATWTRVGSSRSTPPAERAAGVWAAGNVASPRAQVITAAGEGSTAAISINADLVRGDVERAVSASVGPADSYAF